MRLFEKTSSGTLRIQLEDALKHLLDCDESGRGATVDSLAGALSRPRGDAAEILGQLRSRGLATAIGDVHRLTEDGRLYALQVVRTHRLYETWLARETSTPAVDWHREAHKAEHHLEAAEVDAMADRLNNPRFDPHGDPIPTREGQLPKRTLTALASWPDGRSARIEHIEDEPEALFQQAEALGFSPGTRLDESRHLVDGSIECLTEGRRVTIPAAVTSLIHVAAPEPGDLPPAGLGRLSDLAVGGEALVYALAPSCTGPERRRLLDLGVVPGTRIRCEFASPFGTPRSYDIRGALIALREHQADRILIHDTAAKA
ncbi:MAG: metal-dependent transcriptional regulator [Luteolibacter sp.]|jgi:DtxR family Mn-dependent transcriptional regulator|nr:metal-dependent transcriptional regulator [Luteolibacter sp.]